MRPDTTESLLRQSSYAFHWFENLAECWREFLDFFVDAWPAFEAAYDSQIISLWQLLEVRKR